MGFWSLGIGSPREKKKDKKRATNVETLHKLRCSACPLDSLEKSLNNPKMKATGSDEPLIYILGEAPGRQEDEDGEQFVGDSGQLLRGNIPKKYLNRIRWNNTIRCRPPKNRNPTLIETECCRQWIVEDIEKSKPKAIFAIGGVPLNWLNGSDGVYRWRGRCSPVQVGSHVCWAFFHLHPAGLLRMRRSRRGGKEVKSEAENTFVRDLKLAFKIIEDLPPAKVISPYNGQAASPTGAVGGALGYPTTSLKPATRPAGTVGSVKKADNLPSRPVLDFSNPGVVFRGVSYVTGSDKEDVGKVASWLKECKEQPSVALDLETNTKEKLKSRHTRPYGEGAKILTVALAFGGRSFAFPLYHQDAGWPKLDLQLVEKMFLEYLRDAKGVKVAHNLSFELEWLGYFYGKELIYWGKWGDTMGQAYVLDERKQMLSLDDLTLQHLGFNLKSLINLDMSNLDNETLEMVLTYNALDSLYEHKLYLKQKKLLKDQNLLKVYQRHIPPIQAAVLTQLFGNKIDFDLVSTLDKKYSRARDKFSAKIKNTKAVKELEKMRGKPFSPSSHPDVIALFKDALDHSEVWDEEKGRFSADDKALSKIDRPLARWVRKFRSYSGMKSKYIDPLTPEAKECVFPDGRVHPNLHIFFTATGRTSSSDPNEQFWPKKEEEFRELRAEFVAEEDCYLVAIDQGQIEARVIQMAAKDKRYGRYLWDRQDVHMDWTQRLAHAYPERIGGKKFIKDKETMKWFRHDVKNQWTFPLFFGASPYSVSNYLSIPIEVIRTQVDIFWDEFSGIKEWQDDLEAFYDQNGYVECLTGRRRRHPISHNELINSPIQGTASDITVSAWSRLSRAACELDMWQFQACLEVHDELCFQIPKKTFDRDLEFIVDHLLDCDHFDFINVPLCVEVSRGPDWFHQEPVGVFYSDDLGKLDRRKCGY